MRLLDRSTRRLGLACLLVLAACGTRKESAPATRDQGATGAPAPTDTRTNPRPTAQPANNATPGPAAGAANPTNVHTPKPGQPLPGGPAGAAAPGADERPADEPSPPPAKGQAN